MLRRGSRISSPIIEPLSSPLRENAIVDQKTMSLSRVLGTRLSGVNGVADPKRYQETTASAMRKIAGTQSPTAPALWSHLPTASPRTLSVTARPSAAREKAM